jgi:hypothetical protein
MKIYLSGPMRGLKDWNREAFDVATRLWQQDGHQVFSPWANLRALGYEKDKEVEPTSQSGKEHLKHVMMGDIASIYASDAIALLRGWEWSRGCTVELALAQFLGLKIYLAESKVQVEVPLTPWKYLGLDINPDWSKLCI